MMTPMQWTSLIAIFGLFWVLSAFIVLPIGLRTPDEVEGHEVQTGHADSAPVNFRPGKVALRATILAAVLSVLFTLNWSYGWVTREDLNFYGEMPSEDLGY